MYADDAITYVSAKTPQQAAELNRGGGSVSEVQRSLFDSEL